GFFGVGAGVDVTAQFGAAYAYAVTVANGADGDGTNDQLLDSDVDIAAIPGLGAVFLTLGVGNGGGETIYRLREGIDRLLITDINNPAGSAEAQSTLPIMWDIVASSEAAVVLGADAAVHLYNHVPGGSNVLYMDGHVAFQRYPDGFPASRTFAAFGSFFG